MRARKEKGQSKHGFVKKKNEFTNDEKNVHSNKCEGSITHFAGE